MLRNQTLVNTLNEFKLPAGILSFCEEKKQEKSYVKVTFKPTSNVAHFLPQIEPICSLLRASPEEKEFKQNEQHYPLVIMVEIDPVDHSDKLNEAMRFIGTNKLIAAIKNNLGDLTAKQLNTKATSVIKEAKESYNPLPTAGSFVHAIDLFGIHEAIRNSKTTNRFNETRADYDSDEAALLALLKDESTGYSLRSYRYALASTLLGVKVDNDKDAARLIELTKNELSRKIKNLASPQEEKDLALEAATNIQTGLKRLTGKA